MKKYEEKEIPQPSKIEIVLVDWVCDCCNKSLPLDTDGSRLREDRAQLYLSPSPSINIINDQLVADLCAECWQKVYDTLIGMDIHFDYHG